MTPRDARVFLSDALAAIDDIGRYTVGMDAGAFSSSGLVQHAVETQRITIGEALAALRRTDPAAARP